MKLTIFVIITLPLLISCGLFDPKPQKRGQDLTTCNFTKLKEGRVKWGELIDYLGVIIIELGDCGARNDEI